jgi:hypothetical protein
VRLELISRNGRDGICFEVQLNDESRKSVVLYRMYMILIFQAVPI